MGAFWRCGMEPFQHEPSTDGNGSPRRQGSPRTTRSTHPCPPAPRQLPALTRAPWALWFLMKG